ncbi:MAG TPA: hypothetical protein VGI78_08750, partial [Acetobacteraceae bacterium]
PLTPCARISLLKKFANIDVQEWYPAHEASPDAAKDWTYDTQLKLAEASFKAGYPIGFGCGSGSTDANQTWAPRSVRSVPIWSMPRATSPSSRTT